MTSKTYDVKVSLFDIGANFSLVFIIPRNFNHMFGQWPQGFDKNVRHLHGEFGFSSFVLVLVEDS